MNDSSWVSDAFQPTFEYFGATVSPGVPDGTTIAEISLRPSAPVPVTAVTVTNDVMSVPELVMNALGAVDHPLVAVADGGRPRRRRRPTRRPAR